MGRGWLFIIAIAGAAAACSESSGGGHDAGALPSEVTYIGALAGGETRIAFVQGGRAIQAYVCGRGDTLESHTRWFEGELDGADGGVVELAGDGWQLRVLADGSSLSGELISPSGDAQRWSAERASDDPASEVGLYESYDTGCRSGVIVWEALDGPCARPSDARRVRGR
jgi:hypothetical protein